MSETEINDTRSRPVEGGSLVLFDGVCNLCCGAVTFIIKRDRQRLFRFAPLQSPAARAHLEAAGLSAGALETLVLYEQGRWHTQSSAALRIARGLKAPWPLLYALIIVPWPLRDALYRFVARRRYGWFGQRSACMAPSPENADRFLDHEHGWN